MTARAYFFDRRLVGLQHNLVDGPLLAGKAAVNGPGTGNIGSVVVILTPGIYQQQVAVLDARIVGHVVQGAGIGSRTHDWLIRGLGSVQGKLIEQFRLDFVFPHARSTMAHRPLVRRHTNARGFAHRRDLAAAFEQAHVVQVMIQRNEFLRRVDVAAASIAQPAHPFDQPLVELRVAAHGVKHPLTLLEHARQYVVNVINGKSVVGAELFDGTFGAGPAAVPGFALGITLATKQYKLGLVAARHQHGHRFRLGKSGQVIKVAILAKRILHVAIALFEVGRWHDRHPALSYHAAELPSPARKLPGIQSVTLSRINARWAPSPVVRPAD